MVASRRSLTRVSAQVTSTFCFARRVRPDPLLILRGPFPSFPAACLQAGVAVSGWTRLVSWWVFSIRSYVRFPDHGRVGGSAACTALRSQVSAM